MNFDKRESPKTYFLFDRKRLAIVLGGILGIGILIGYNLAI